MLFGKHINKYYIKYLIPFLIGIIALVIVDIFQLEIPEIIGEIIDKIEYKTLTKDELLSYMLRLFLIALIMFVGRFSWRITIFGNSIRIDNDLREEMFKKTEKLSQNFFNNNKTGALMALYINDLNTIKSTFANGIIMFIDAFFLGGLAFYKMWMLNSTLTIISAIPLFLLAILGGLIGKSLKKKSEINHNAFADLSYYAQESFSGISVIKAFVKEARELREFKKYNKKNMDTTMDMVKYSVLFEILLSLIISSVLLIIIGYGGFLVYQNRQGIIDNNFSIGSLTKFVSFFGSLIWPMTAIGRLINVLSQGKASLKRISSLLNEKIEINDNLVNDTDFIVKGSIEFNNFSFSYPNTERKVLDNINLKINEGEMIGIIGRTGSSKSTIVNVLARFYNVEEGTLFIDGYDIMKIPLKVLRENISIVPQDNFLFSQSILENISFYTSDVDYEKAVNASKLADVDKDISSFKEEYNTILGERGVTVSGGQRQRISIARALIKDSPILILDDSVSAVDTKTEEIILNNLREIRKGKTTIIIAHRISTLETLDKIIVIDDGKVTGFDNHDNLLKNNSLYQKQVKLQELEKEAGGKNEWTRIKREFFY